jgi:hypothetical protein
MYERKRQMDNLNENEPLQEEKIFYPYGRDFKKTEEELRNEQMEREFYQKFEEKFDKNYPKPANYRYVKKVKNEENVLRAIVCLILYGPSALISGIILIPLFISAVKDLKAGADLEDVIGNLIACPILAICLTGLLVVYPIITIATHNKDQKDFEI